MNIVLRLSYTLLIALLVLNSASHASAATELVLHTHFKYDAVPNHHFTGRMPRELGRQALLMAAREQLGMQTCDMTLREQPATDDPIELLAIIEAVPNGEYKLRLFDRGALEAGEKPPAEENAIHELVFTPPGLSDGFYTSAAKALEEASRGELTEFLRGLGGEASKSVELDEPAEEFDIETLQSQVDTVSQFVAIRELHHRYRNAPTAEKLQALVRGYANLSLLNETNWGASCMALQARTLMYGARLEALHADHPLTAWSLAYADAIVGIHYRAIERQNSMDSDPEEELPPTWTAVIDPYCHFDLDRLEQIAMEESSISNWAAYLRAWTVYNSHETTQLTHVGREAIEACPEAFNLYYLMVRGQPIGIMRYSNAGEVRAMLSLLPTRLVATAGVPPNVVEVASNPDREKPPGLYWRNMMDALREAESGADPSWGLLASLLDDQAMRAASNSLAVNRGASTEIDLTPTADYWQPFVDDHPDGAYVRTVSLLRAQEPKALQDACAELRFRDPNRWMYYAYYFDTRLLENARGEKIGLQAGGASSRDFTCQSISRALSYTKPSGDYFEMLLHELNKVSPHSPVPLIKAIEGARRGGGEPELEVVNGWKEKAGSSSTAWRELGKAYLALEQQDETIECFEKSIELSPNNSTFFDLARAHERFGNMDQVVPTYERLLEEEDLGLGHSNAHCAIANHLMLQDDLDTAKEHAIKAAQAYSARSLRVAAQVCELLHDLGEADKYYAALSNSYPSSSGLDWFLFRKRLEGEDLEAPRQLVSRYFSGHPNWQKSSTWKPIACLIAEDKHKEAFDACVVKAKERPDIFSEAFLLLTALAADEPETAKAAKGRLYALLDEADGTEDWGKRYRKLMEDVLVAKAGDDGTDETEIQNKIDSFLHENIFAHIYKSDRGYFIAKLLELQGYEKAATHCYRLTTTLSRTPERITWRLASIDLNRLELEAEE